MLAPPRWVRVHWRGELGNRRSRGCDADGCPADWHAEPWIWTGYASALLPRRDRAGAIVGYRIVLEIKWREAESIDRLIRGLGPWPIVASSRESGGFAFTLAGQETLTIFPRPEPAFDVLPTLLSYWKIGNVAVATAPTILEYRREAQ
jgi:hypothetical protein